MLQYTLFFEV